MSFDFQLIETMLFDSARGGYPFLERHLARLAGSSRHFGFVCELQLIRTELERTARELPCHVRHRVRLLLSGNGEMRIESTVISEDAGSAWSLYSPPQTTAALVAGTEDSRVLPKIAISSRRTDPSDVFLYHKTTHRELYDDEFRLLSQVPGVFEVVFFNTRGELTEGSRTNVFIAKDGLMKTPRVEAGLLNGVMRQTLLDSAAGSIREERLALADLNAADRVWVANSVRGLVEVRLLGGNER